MNEKISQILQEIEHVVVGKNEIVEKILMAILASGHVLMEDVPGVGKTTTAMAFARVLGLDSRRVQFTSDTMPSDILGFSVYEKSTGTFVYKPGAVMTNLLLADEINKVASEPYEYVYDRHSVRQKRSPREIGLHSVRGGSIVGEHEILFCGPDEVITLSHSAGSRRVFANGAVNAAVFLADKGPGLYTMKDLMKELL